MKLILRLFMLVLIALNVACTMTGATYEASGYNVREIEENLNNDLAVGDFTRTESDRVQDPWIFRGASKIRSPIGDGHHDFIADAITNELMLARKLDGQSNLVLKGDLLEHKVDAAMSTGVGSVEMKFTLNAEGKVLYDETKRIEHKWNSAFVGTTAANKAVRGHLEMIEMLIKSLFADIDFINAINE